MKEVENIIDEKKQGEASSDPGGQGSSGSDHTSYGTKDE